MTKMSSDAQNSDTHLMTDTDTNIADRKQNVNASSLAMKTTKVETQSIKEKSASTQQTSNISFILTGFGPFGGVSSNPTTTIIQQLQELKKAKDFQDDGANNNVDESMNSKNSILSKVVDLQVIPVSAQGVKDAMEDIISCVHKVKNEGKNDDSGSNDSVSGSAHTNSNENPSPRHVVLVHMGVNHMKNKKPQFHLEQNAYNEANFRIPDEDGYQPKKEVIDLSNGMSKCTKLSTDLNVKRIQKHMNTELSATATSDSSMVGLSGDAGRFVCNYLYWTSLNRVSQEFLNCNIDNSATGGNVNVNTNADAQTDSDTDCNNFQVHVLFVHVPSFEGIEQDIQVAMSIQLLESITEAIVAKDKKARKKRR